MKELVGISGDKELATVMAFGCPSDEAATGTRVRETLPKMTHSERFGQSYGA